jgi:putative flippase GtrA
MKIKPKLQELLKQPLYRYLIIGVSVYLFELIVIVVAQSFGANADLAVGVSFWLGLFASFWLQKLVTFSDKRMHRRILLPQFIAASLLVAFNFSFTLLVTHLLSPPLPPVATRTLALGITTIWNFYLYKTRIFNRSDELVY